MLRFTSGRRSGGGKGRTGEERSAGFCVWRWSVRWMRRSASLRVGIGLMGSSRTTQALSLRWDGCGWVGVGRRRESKNRQVRFCRSLCAGRTGFEPAARCNPCNCLAGSPNRPLWHLPSYAVVTAEGVGFEPTVTETATLVFKTNALNHSAILPYLTVSSAVLAL